MEVNEQTEIQTEQSPIDTNTSNSTVVDNKTFSQAELEEQISKRLARQEKSIRKQIETEFEEKVKKQNMSEVEKLIAEKDEVINKASEKMKTANERLLKADFKIVANELGIVDSEVAYMLIDKTELQDEDGNVNVEEMKKSLETLIASKPYLKGQVQQQIANLPASPSFKSKATELDVLKHQHQEAIKSGNFLQQIAIKNKINELSK